MGKARSEEFRETPKRFWLLTPIGEKEENDFRRDGGEEVPRPVGAGAGRREQMELLLGMPGGSDDKGG